jgi:septal ring-binding cell division protein DamX
MAQWMGRLRNTPSTQYTIQVEICGNLNFIQDDLNLYLSEYDAMAVPFKVKSWKAYTLLVGLFDTREQGKAAIHKLPPYIRKKSPLVMTVDIIQKGMGPENKFKKSQS